MSKPIYIWQHRVSGKVIGEIRRFPPRNGKPKQDIPFYKPNENGFDSGGPAAPYPLIGLDSYHDICSPVIVCEGQKKQQAWSSLGFQAVACLFGAQASASADWTALRSAKKIYIAPDNDGPGEKFAQDVWAIVKPFGAELGIIRLKNLKKKEDVCDWLKRLPELEDWNEYDALDRHPERDAISTKLWDAVLASLAEPPGHWQLPEEWPEPESLAKPIKEITRIIPKMIPAQLRDWVCDIAHRMQCPLEYVAIAALITTGAAIGSRVSVRPKRVDSWSEYANLWGAVCGPPGSMKTPAMKEAMQPLERIDSKYYSEYKEQSKTYETTKAKYDAEIKAYKDAAGGKGRYSKLADDAAPEKPDEPICKQFIANDTTIEAMAKLFAENPQGLMLFQDELSHMLAKWKQSDHAPDRSFYLETWSGKGSRTVNRIGRGQLRVENMCLSVLGGMQPDTMRAYLVSASEDSNDGLLQRFQMSVYLTTEEEEDRRNIVDVYPNYGARDAAQRLIKDLAEVDYQLFGAAVDQGADMPFFRFADDAQDDVFEWLGLLTKEIAAEETDIMKQHLSKYRKLMPALALIFHCLEVVSTRTVASISKQNTALAIVWCKVMEAHARRIYDLSAPREVGVAYELSKHIKRGALESPFANRHIVKKNWRGLNKRENVDQALKSLCEHNWLRQVISRPGPNGGAPKIEYHINPKLQLND